ncbi:cytochrome b561 domain-containing protein At2g30890-like isoform X2 [Salvia miltiorrhiza]|uniref:cytochrome b561 domain-containing protein At2g30890-like isoform X2 n=1 Tax=Salvia miltiorrhiza TaxID=226208 RepID=UPI0025AD8295|nr:cytochrome b561 domain-containing protein At2g30890-like isoform X2 [Salvia miltiorrhiza]
MLIYSYTSLNTATKMFAAHNLLSLAGLLLFNLLPLVASLDDQHTSKHNLQKVTPKLSYQIKLHAFLLWASVGFLMPISVLIKRISNSDPSPTKLTIIFYTHAITQVCAVLLATAGGLISIKYFDNSFSNHHQKIGLLFYAAILLQTMLSIWRPQRGSKGRKIWFVFHWLVGIAALLVGVMNVFTGLEAYHERMLEDVRIWRVAFMVELCLMLLVYLLQEKWHYLTHQHKTEAC